MIEMMMGYLRLSMIWLVASYLPVTIGDKTCSYRSQESKSAVKFEATLMGEMRDEDGRRLAFTTFRSPDGTKLTLTHHRFDSGGEAQVYFDKAIEHAAKVVSKTQTKDKSGIIVRQRAEVIFHVGRDSGETESAIVWTDGPEFHEIVSKSKQDNLLLERQVSH